MTVHFTGIKGVGMAALALAYGDRGWKVRGSDTKEEQITDQPLRERKIEVFERFTPRNISRIENSRWLPVIDKLIYTGAHHGAQNVEVKWAVSRKIPAVNYARSLGEFFAEKQQICVCGVGGKTTTAAMLATILYNVLGELSWIVGTSQISSLPAPGHWGAGEWAVIEGDEYAADPIGDKTPKFMYLNPKIAVCTNISYDHPDIYKSEAETLAVYLKLFKKTLRRGGKVLLSSQAAKVLNNAGGKFRKLPGWEVYETEGRGELAKKIKKILQVPGEYNVSNALAAVAVASKIGVPPDRALAALAAYTGAKRRFEFIGRAGEVDIYDDYAHHPTEIRALALAAREKFPGKKIRFVFQPHTFSRTKALFSEFVDSLKPVDEVVMYPIFASAREEKDDSVSSAALADEIVRRGGNASSVASGKELIEYISRSSTAGEVIFTVGAGNLYAFHQKIIDSLKKSR